MLKHDILKDFNDSNIIIIEQLLFNEIVINDGEYVPVSNDPTYT